MFGCDDAGRSVKIARSCIIAQAFPELEHSVGVRLSQSFHSGKALYPSVPVGDHGLDLGLLKHDFRDPDRVRIDGSAPGKVAGVFDEPIEQRTNQSFWFRHGGLIY